MDGCADGKRIAADSNPEKALGIFCGLRGGRNTTKTVNWEWEARAELGPSLLPSGF